jgi:glycosyltransferase involved in cell wall biosynthesis
VPGTDHDIDDHYARKLSLNDSAKLRLKNANLLLNLDQMTWGISPTQFQRSLFPSSARERCSVIHDGIDLEWLRPNAKAELLIASGKKLHAGEPVITFVNRTFEPYRGIHIFLDALTRIQSRHSRAQVVLVGEDTPHVSYGSHRPDGLGWLEALKKHHGDCLDWGRIHCLGTVPHHVLKRVYQVSAVHVYLSYPFVMSWSLLESMACGCLVVGSATQPVQEVIKDGFNGFLVPFQDSIELADTVLRVLAKSQDMQSLRRRARKSTGNYALPTCLKQQIRLIDSLLIS